MNGHEDLSQTLKRIRREQNLTSPRVFLYRKLIVKRVDRVFKGVLRKAGVEDFKFHDLKHTFASHLVMRSVSLREIKSFLDARL